MPSHAAHQSTRAPESTLSAHPSTHAQTAAADSYAAEITDKSNRARAMGLVGAVFSTGMLVGPLLGGALAQPAAKLPWLVPVGSLFDRNPYALPTTLCGYGAPPEPHAFVPATTPRAQKSVPSHVAL